MALGGSLQDGTSRHGERLELVQTGERVEYRLAGRRVEPGTILELELAECWVTGRFEWSGAQVRWPSLRVPLGGPWMDAPMERQPTAAMPLPPDARLRWPTHR